MHHTQKQRVKKVVDLLEKKLSKKKSTGLKHWKEDWQFLFAVILSAQANDDQINKVTPKLFKEIQTLDYFANANINAIMDLIRSIGFYRNKSKFLQRSAQIMIKDYNKEVPSKLVELVTLPGVGRKTANVYQGVILGSSEGIAVDTHVSRLSNRLELTREKVADKIEKDLMRIIPKKQYHRANPLFFWHGREVCIARKPKCSICVLNKICPSRQI